MAVSEPARSVEPGSPSCRSQFIVDNDLKVVCLIFSAVDPYLLGEVWFAITVQADSPGFLGWRDFTRLSLERAIGSTDAELVRISSQRENNQLAVFLFHWISKDASQKDVSPLDDYFRRTNFYGCRAFLLIFKRRSGASWQFCCLAGLVDWYLQGADCIGCHDLDPYTRLTKMHC